MINSSCSNNVSIGHESLKSCIIDNCVSIGY